MNLPLNATTLATQLLGCATIGALVMPTKALQYVVFLFCCSHFSALRTPLFSRESVPGQKLKSGWLAACIDSLAAQRRYSRTHSVVHPHSPCKKVWMQSPAVCVSPPMTGRAVSHEELVSAAASVP